MEYLSDVPRFVGGDDLDDVRPRLERCKRAHQDTPAHHADIAQRRCLDPVHEHLKADDLDVVGDQARDQDVLLA